MPRRISSADAACGQLADRLAGAGQQIAAGVDHRDVVRAQARHRRGDEVEDGLHALLIQPLRARHRQHHARLGLLLLARERFAARQHEVHAGRADAADRRGWCGPVRPPSRGFR